MLQLIHFFYFFISKFDIRNRYIYALYPIQWSSKCSWEPFSLTLFFQKKSHVSWIYNFIIYKHYPTVVCWVKLAFFGKIFTIQSPSIPPYNIFIFKVINKLLIYVPVGSNIFALYTGIPFSVNSFCKTLLPIESVKTLVSLSLYPLQILSLQGLQIFFEFVLDILLFSYELFDIVVQVLHTLLLFFLNFNRWYWDFYIFYIWYI
ncbi:Uncharacterised protein (plasmid) [Mesomycoplasma conjunctivae]|nr:Uncharacterised protein [Mesomycoplasma conjunctivae]